MTLLKKLDLGGEVAIAALVVAVIALMILPLPTFLIDTLLAINITISVVLLMITMYIPSAVSFSSFPSLLLFTTLFRLSLNIASTKSILLHADAGSIIESFGELVVGGNLVVGLVVFLIIATVQFIVIAKGSERVAEVGARFTLDAMPGKQMSIDADVRAGNLNPDVARHRRALLATESQLHGGMDGAMKFVKGDAIAGLVITLVNILAGIVIGITYHGMTAAEAANRFAVLSIGDAMVSQIPSLLISVAAGIMITRVAGNEDAGPTSLGAEIAKQLCGNARALFSACALLTGFAFVPGFPSALFLVLAGLVCAAGFYLWRQEKNGGAGGGGAPLPALQREGAKDAATGIADAAPPFASPLAMRLSPGLAALLNTGQFNTAITAGRQRLSEELGLPFPGLSMWKSVALDALSYEVLMHDVPVARVALPAQLAMLEQPDDALKAQAQELRDVAGMAHSWWADTALRQANPAAPLRASEVLIAGHALQLLREQSKLFVGVQETQWILERLAGEYPGLVEEVKKALPAQRIADVLRRLLEEQIPIRNMRAIMESLVAWGPKEKDMLMLTEYVRGDLGRYIAHTATAGTGRLQAVMLDVAVEQLIRQSIKATPAGNYLTLPPDQVDAIIVRLEQIAGSPPPAMLAVVTSMDIRRYFRRMIEQRLAWLPVYSFQELGGDVQLLPLGKLVM
ncbi:MULTISPECIES: type III secretion system export apparatus subunit SctV [unclassified Duganella]|uniref:type III secretion system export apparatus subunit SctV n=1 Tax=unclassified Duganella TaxID=2636909 RepID=UPI000E34A824|nr:MULTISPECIES: type III secretion system export apparatus subunit SctV [unclassified Duganella]RFP09348.1 EscV/YscV/HrcV family type III secretion system export apparatus protein [Duganella sp. BJB475]RFP25384.1 EscV/YscV/HrcV family type III secretion system export apparatus protein [Duganella sp. BJB476]